MYAIRSYYALDDAELARDQADGAYEGRDLDLARLGREVVHVDIAPLRDDEHMHRRLRVDVVKGERVLSYNFV